MMTHVMTMHADAAALPDLVRRAKERDEGAVEQLCLQFHDGIYRYILYKVSQKEDAEDLTSEVFGRMVRSLHEQRGDFKTWLYRIAANAVVDFYRRRAVERRRMRDLQERQGFGAERMNTDNVVAREVLERALARLTADQREVVVLRFFEGFSTEETARVVNKSVNAVKSLQFRALAELRGLLGSDGEMAV